MQYFTANLIGISSGASHAPSQPDWWYNCINCTKSTCTLNFTHSTVVKGFKVQRLNSLDWHQLGASHAPSQPDCSYNPGVVVELFVLFSGCQLTVLMLGAQRSTQSEQSGPLV